MTGLTQDILVMDEAAPPPLQPHHGRADGDRSRHQLSLRPVRPLSPRKVIKFRSVIDSFDAAEQILGHPIDLRLADNPLPRDDASLAAVLA
ncbi:MAG TPA: hypothetical protein VNK48_03265 [Xanthobacteraceae bacterium]|nr:hypothetical protein [Xanthobacteraceae bacterium]